MKISVFGIGYVGVVTASCLADSGHTVTAVDVDSFKVDCLNEGRSPVQEAGLHELIRRNTEAGRLRASMDGATAVLESKVSLVCVGTPGREDGSLILEQIEEVCAWIGRALKKTDDYHVVVIRSTVLPGTLDNVIRPLLEEESGKKSGVDFGLGNNPEFLREGNAIEDFFRPTKIVAGTTDQKAADAIMDLYEGIEAPRIVCEPAVAEGVKYVSNSWRAHKVAFANEVGNILKGHGVDSHRVMDIFFEDTRINLGRSFLIPGFAFGGPCLPKDVRALTKSAHDKGVQTPLFSSIFVANDRQIERGFSMIRESGCTRVGLLGLSFKPGTDDLRESPLVTLAGMILAAGLDLKIYDPCVNASVREHAVYRQNIKNFLPGIFASLVTEPRDIFSASDIVVIGKNAPGFSEIVTEADESLPVVDLVRLGPAVEQRKLYKGICW